MTKPARFILSASHRQSSDWLTANPQTDPPTILTLPSQLAGIYTPHIICVGTYWKHPQWSTFLVEFQRRDATLEYPEGERSSARGG